MNNKTPGTSHGTILVVDDERTSLKLLTAVLTVEGYSVHAANSGEQALELVASTPPDLILLDIVMPGIDGFEVCRQLQASEQTRSIPVLFLSATTATQERVEGFKLGAVDFLIKPFQRQELLARVRTHLSLSRLQARLKQQAVDLQQANMLLQSEIEVRKVMASSLAESEEKFRTLAGSAQDAFVMLDDEDRIVFWNRAAAGMFGYTEQEITGEKFHARLTPERFRLTSPDRFSHPRFPVPDAAPTNGKIIEMIALRKDGSEFPIELSTAAVKLRDKWVTIAVIRDITERQRVQETLQRSEARLNLALEAAHMGAWDLDLVSNTVWRSRLHDQIFGYNSPLPQWNYEILLAHIVPEDREKIRKVMSDVRDTRQFKTECRMLRASDQAERWICFEGEIYRDKQDTPIHIMGMVADITENKLAEQERQANEAQSSLTQKLESVGRLASGVAHEINTPMQFITDNTQFLKRAMSSLTETLVAYRTTIKTVENKESPDEALALARAAEEKNELDYLLGEIPRTFDETMSGLHRVTQIIKSLKEFAHPNKASKQPADLNASISTTTVVSRHEWKYVADLVTEFDPDLPMIPLRIDEMNQVMLNLIVNASHAIGDALKQRGGGKGVITIRTKCEGDNVHVEVQDNGTGIPVSAQSHIFEPFFTTKGVGKGTGQGLAIVRTIVVKNHGGTIGFTTEQGKGTTFHICLPLLVADEGMRSEATDA